MGRCIEGMGIYSFQDAFGRLLQDLPGFQEPVKCRQARKVGGKELRPLDPAFDLSAPFILPWEALFDP